MTSTQSRQQQGPDMTFTQPRQPGLDMTSTQPRQQPGPGISCPPHPELTVLPGRTPCPRTADCRPPCTWRSTRTSRADPPTSRSGDTCHVTSAQTRAITPQRGGPGGRAGHRRGGLVAGAVLQDPGSRPRAGLAPGAAAAGRGCLQGAAVLQSGRRPAGPGPGGGGRPGRAAGGA